MVAGTSKVKNTFSGIGMTKNKGGFKMKAKSYKSILNIVQKVTNHHFTESEQEIIDWYTDKEIDNLHICKGELNSKTFTIEINKFTGEAKFKWL